MAEILLYDYQDEWGYDYVIGMGDLAGSVISQRIEELSGQDVLLRINSVGGSCYAAIQIINAIKKHGNVTAQIDGIAFSAAAFISAACQSVKASEWCMYMIHNCRMELLDYGVYTAEDLRRIHDQDVSQMEAWDKLAVKLFVDKTGLSEEEISQMLEQETWLTATEAKELGFIDEITEEETQNINKNSFARAPMRMVAMANKHLKLIENDNNMSVINELKAQHEENKGFFAELKAMLGIKAQADTEVVPEPVIEAVVEDPIIEDSIDDLKAKIVELETERAESIQALADAKAMMAETKTLLSEVKSTYKPADKTVDFNSKENKDAPAEISASAREERRKQYKNKK